MSLYSGMPRFLFGQRYWGETSSEKMRELLQEARNSNWRAALQRCVADEPLSEHLLSPVRADFLHAMPWDRSRNVLDIGAGMGFMSCDMALYADSVVSLEAVPERAKFIQIRATQDKLNVHPIIASATALPFPAESFDLITLNGVFEYVGLWGQGDPKALQEQFLASTLRLLRPGGYLYVGIETRYASTAFFGNRDHSGLAFTSLMPRRLADLYCRIRSRPFYGSEPSPRDIERIPIPLCSTGACFSVPDTMTCTCRGCLTDITDNERFTILTTTLAERRSLTECIRLPRCSAPCAERLPIIEQPTARLRTKLSSSPKRQRRARVPGPCLGGKWRVHRRL